MSYPYKAGLYVVADGVGGHVKGEIASQEAVEQIQNWVRNGHAEVEAFLRDPSDKNLAQVKGSSSAP